MAQGGRELKPGVANNIRLINEAHADPAFRELRDQTTRGGDERRRAVVADGVPDGGGEAAEAPPLVDLNDLGRVAGKSRALSDGLWGAYLGAYEVATAEERLRMVEGLSKGAWLALLAIPMAEPFTLTQAQFQRTFDKYLGTQGQVTLFFFAVDPSLRQRQHSGPHGCHGESLGELSNAGAGKGATQRGSRRAHAHGRAMRRDRCGGGGDFGWQWRGAGLHGFIRLDTG